jgi:ribosomal-protein-alanine N-acetyltransferase
MKIQEMQISDLGQVMAIEKMSFRTPWKKSFFEYDLKRKGGNCLVAKENDEIFGYADAWLVGDEMHLANLAVTTQHRQQGIGSVLLTKIIEIAKTNKCRYVLLEVRVSNINAKKFYEKFGFNALYLRRKYYPDGEDALVYEKRL